MKKKKIIISLLIVLGILLAVGIGFIIRPLSAEETVIAFLENYKRAKSTEITTKQNKYVLDTLEAYQEKENETNYTIEFVDFYEDYKNKNLEYIIKNEEEIDENTICFTVELKNYNLEQISMDFEETIEKRSDFEQLNDEEYQRVAREILEKLASDKQYEKETITTKIFATKVDKKWYIDINERRNFEFFYELTQHEQYGIFIDSNYDEEQNLYVEKGVKFNINYKDITPINVAIIESKDNSDYNAIELQVKNNTDKTIEGFSIVYQNEQDDEKISFDFHETILKPGEISEKNSTQLKKEATLDTIKLTSITLLTTNEEGEKQEVFCDLLRGVCIAY